MKIDSSHLPQFFCPGTTRRHSNTRLSPIAQEDICWRYMWWKDRLSYGELESKHNQGGFSTMERGQISDMKVVKEQADHYTWGRGDISSLGCLLKPCWYLSALLSWPAPWRVPHINIDSGVSMGRLRLINSTTTQARSKALSRLIPTSISSMTC